MKKKVIFFNRLARTIKLILLALFLNSLILIVQNFTPGDIGSWLKTNILFALTIERGDDLPSSPEGSSIPTPPRQGGDRGGEAQEKPTEALEIQESEAVALEQKQQKQDQETLAEPVILEPSRAQKTLPKLKEQQTPMRVTQKSTNQPPAPLPPPPSPTTFPLSTTSASQTTPKAQSTPPVAPLPLPPLTPKDLVNAEPEVNIEEVNTENFFVITEFFLAALLLVASSAFYFIL